VAGHPGYRLRWDDGIVEIRWTCGKANAMNGRSLAALKRALDDAEAADARGVVLTGYDRFFSAGPDLVTLYDLEPRAMDAFMIDFDRLMLRAFAFSRPLITAVGGHAVAGGCVLALAGDVRVMTADGAQMGLNEIRLGVPFPAPALEIVRHARPSDLIVCGTHGRSALGRIAFGSVATKLLWKAPCPVLVVRPAETRARDARSTEKAAGASR